MIKPTRDFLIALVLTVSGLAAFAFGLMRLLEHGENDMPGSIAVAVGGLVTLFGIILVLNFRWAMRIARRMQRGEGVFARWTVPVETVTAYLAAESARPLAERSRWKPKPGAPAEILFSDDGILAGGTYHGLSAKGLQTYTAVDLVYGSPVMIEFATREVAVVGDRLTSHHAILRLPIARGADEPAGKVIAHFKLGLSDAVRTNPTFWLSRKRIGLVILALCAILFATGWFMAEQGGWRADDTQGLTAMVLMITGAVFSIAGAFLFLLASAKLRQR
jgi:hypothetical protein